MSARYTRDSQWELMERIAREGVVWICPWDKHRRHGQRCSNHWCRARVTDSECPSCKLPARPDDGVYVFGLIGSNELFQWLQNHKDWFKRGPWVEKRCARSLRLTAAGLAALSDREPYDMEPIHGGMVEPGYIVVPWPRKNVA